jgi:hypothetical protein
MRTACIIISILLIAYVVTLAIVVPFSIDEAWTWEEFVKGEFWNVVTYAHPVPNNHILNSLLVKPFHALSDSELSLRMPNILAFFLYLYAAYSISANLFTNKLLSLCLFVSLMLDTTLIHFFALCRGYGIGIGLLLFSISKLLLFSRSFNMRQLHISLLAAVLAVYASFTILPAYLAITVVAVYLLYKHHHKLWASLKWPSLYVAILFCLIAYPLKQIVSWDTFDYGGQQGFLHDTLSTFLIDLLGSVAQQYHDGIIIIVCSLFIFVFAAVIIKSLKARQPAVYFIMPFVLLFCICCINLEFYLAGIRFVNYRTALYLYPLCILTLFSCIALYLSTYKNFSKAFAVIVTSTLLYFFCTNSYFNTIPEWRFDANTKKVLSFIRSENRNGSKARLYVYHYCAPAYHYYISTKYSDAVAPVLNIGMDEANLDTFDYIYQGREYDILSTHKNFRIVQAYNDSSFLLYRKLP